MKQLHYIGHYADQDNVRNLRVFPSGVAKMKYIKNTLIEAGYKVKIFSPAETKNDFLCHFPSETYTISEQEDVTYIDTFGAPNIIFRIMSRLWMQLQLFMYLMTKVKHAETVLIYHIMIYKNPVRIARWLRKLHLYFEVEEIFNAAWQKNNRRIVSEMSYLRKAKGHFFVNDLMHSKLDFGIANYLVCYGDYRSLDQIELGSKRLKDKIKLVYAGVIEGEGSDVHFSIDAMKYLTDQYELSVIGYGVDDHLTLLDKKIKETNQYTGRKAVSYDGCLYGEQLDKHLFASDIGLCTRVLVDRYSDFTFPSKVLVYLNHNLIPVCSNVRCVKESKVSKAIVFYENTDAQDIAKAILSIKDLHNDNRALLNKLHKDFVAAIPTFFK